MESEVARKVVDAAAGHLHAEATRLQRIGRLSLGNRFEDWLKWELLLAADAAISEGRLPHRVAMVERDKCDLFLGAASPSQGRVYPECSDEDVWIELKCQCTRDAQRGAAAGWKISEDYWKLLKRLKALEPAAPKGLSMFLLVQSPETPSMEELFERMQLARSVREHPHVVPILDREGASAVALLVAWEVRRVDLASFDLEAALAAER